MMSATTPPPMYMIAPFVGPLTGAVDELPTRPQGFHLLRVPFPEIPGA